MWRLESSLKVTVGTAKKCVDANCEAGLLRKARRLRDGSLGEFSNRNPADDARAKVTPQTTVHVFGAAVL